MQTIYTNQDISNDLEKLLAETYATHYILMSLGFSALQLYVNAGYIQSLPVPGEYITVILKGDNEKEFKIWISPVSTSERAAEFIREWAQFIVKRASVMTSEQLREFIMGTEVMKHKMGIIVALTRAGFELNPTEHFS